MNDLTHDRLCRAVSYDAHTGLFTRLFNQTAKTRWEKIANSKWAGKLTGSKDTNGRIQIKIDGRLYFAHRLAWLYTHGRWPASHIDHVNLVRDDNRICNLREATQSENMRNRGKTRSSTSGLKGVCWHTAKAKWGAAIRHNNKQSHLGYFETAEEAHAAYAQAATEMHGQFARIS